MANFCVRRGILTNINRIRHFEKQKVLSAWSFLNVHYCATNNVSNLQIHFPQRLLGGKTFDYAPVRHYSSNDKELPEPPPEKKLSLFKRFKDMYKKYWYVLVPVHVVTSTFWFGGFYYLAKRYCWRNHSTQPSILINTINFFSGVDIISILESMNMSETIIRPLRDSSMGYIAVAYALYKIATPARYAVTLGGTTISINYLKKWGYIKPVPSKERLKEMYREKRDEFIYRTDQMKGSKVLDEFEKSLKSAKDQIQDKKAHIVGNLQKDLKDTQGNLIDKDKTVKKPYKDDKH